MSTIPPESKLYLPAYSNHFTITTISPLYYQTQPERALHLTGEEEEQEPYLPVYTNHFTITNTSLPYYRTPAYILTETTLQ